MKKGYLLIALACITAYGCTKHYSTHTTYDSRDTTGFVVNGVSDISMESRDSIMVNMGIETVSGKEQQLTFSVTGLPANVTGKFSPETGYNFGTMLTLVSNNAALGEHHMTINVSDSTDAIVRSYDVHLTIEPKMYCTEEILGSYIGDYMCTNDTDSVASTIMPLPVIGGNSKDMVQVSGLIPTFTGLAVKAKLVCEGQKIMINNQAAGPFTIWGEGDFATDSLVKVDYHYFDGIDTFSCMASFRKQP